MASRTGRELFLNTVSRTVYVFLEIFVQPSAPAVSAGIMLALSLIGVRNVSYSLPFYSLHTCALHVAADAFVAFSSLGSLVLALTFPGVKSGEKGKIPAGMIFDEARRDRIAYGFLAGAFLFAIACSALPYARYWHLQGKIRPIISSADARIAKEEAQAEAEEAIAAAAEAEAARVIAHEKQTSLPAQNAHNLHGSPAPSFRHAHYTVEQGDIRHGNKRVSDEEESGSLILSALLGPPSPHTLQRAGSMARLSPPILHPVDEEKRLRHLDSKTSVVTDEKKHLPTSVEIAISDPADKLIHIGEVEGDPEAAELFGSEDDVEVVVRAVLHTKVGPDGKEAVPNPDALRLGMYSKWAIARAERVYMEGLRAFPKSSTLRVAFSTFLDTYSQDSARATSMLASARKCTPFVDMRFALFSHGRSLEQARQSESLGEASMNMVGVLAFRKTYKEALTHHKEAVDEITALWRIVWKHSREISSESINERLARITTLRDSAASAYDRMLRKYPNAQVVLRSYASFLQDVANDPQTALRFVSKADSLQRVLDGGGDVGTHRSSQLYSQAKSRGSGSDSGGNDERTSGEGSVNSGGSGDSSRRGRASMNVLDDMRNKAQSYVRRMSRLLSLGILLLIGFAAAIFVTAKMELADYNLAAELLNKAGLRRKLTVDGVYGARDLQLAATLPGGSNATFMAAAASSLSSAKLLDSYMSELYFLKATSEITRLYNDKNVEITYFADAGTPGAAKFPYTGRNSMFNAVSRYVLATIAIAHAPITSLSDALPFSNPSWRYLVDNGLNPLLPLQNKVVQHYEDDHFLLTDLFNIISGCLLAAMAIVLLALGYGIVWRSVHHVHFQSKGVVSVAHRVPRQAAMSLFKKYRNLKVQLDNIEQRLEAEEDGDGDSQAEMLDVENNEGDDADEEEERADEVGPVGRKYEHGTSSRTESMKKASTAAGSSDPMTMSSLSTQSALHAHSASASGEATPVVRFSSHERTSDSDRIPHTQVPGDYQVQAAARSKPALPNADASADDDTVSEPPHDNDSKQDKLPSALFLASSSATQLGDKGPDSREFGELTDEAATLASTSRSPHTRTDRHISSGGGGGSMKRLSAEAHDLVGDERGGVIHAIVVGTRVGQVAPLPSHGAAVASSSGRFAHMCGRLQMGIACFLTPRYSKRRRNVRLSPMLRSVTVRVLAAFVLVFVMQTSVYMWNLFNSDRNALREIAAKINNAGKRRYLTRLVSFYSRELLINDGTFGSLSVLTTSLRSTVNELVMVHESLRYGNPALRLSKSQGTDPDQDALSTSADPTAWYRNDSTTLGLYDFSNKKGLDGAVAAYADFVGSLLSRFEPFYGDPATAPAQPGGSSIVGSISGSWSAATAGVVGRHNSALESDVVLARILKMERATLGALLGKSLSMYTSAVAVMTATSLRASLAVLIVEIFVLVLLELTVLRSMFGRLMNESARTIDFLRLVPMPVILSSPRLKAFYVLQASGQRAKEQAEFGKQSTAAAGSDADVGDEEDEPRTATGSGTGAGQEQGGARDFVLRSPSSKHSRRVSLSDVPLA